MASSLEGPIRKVTLYTECGDPVSGGGGTPVDAKGNVPVSIKCFQQVFNTVDAAPFADDTEADIEADLDQYGEVGVSIAAQGDGAADVAIDLLIEYSNDNSDFFTLESRTLTVPAGMTDQAIFDEVYKTTRRYYRVTISNTSGTDLPKLSAAVVQKPGT